MGVAARMRVVLRGRAAGIRVVLRGRAAGIRVVLRGRAAGIRVVLRSCCAKSQYAGPTRALRALRNLAAGGLIAILALVPAGCAGLGGTPFAQSGNYLCLHHEIDADMLAAATPVTELSGDAATMLAKARSDDGTPLKLDNPDDWYLVAQGDDRVLIMRTVEPEEVGLYGPPNSDREVIEVAQFPDAPNLEDGWLVSGHSFCPLTIDLGGLSVPTVALDPADLPDANSTALHLLVTESDCNSGQAADGRVRLVALNETAESVTVTIGVQPRGGGQDCPSNPATPFVVELSEPLGDRELIDGTRGAPLAVP